uniref:Uncharacterized protein n=1 Tax=Oryza glumipatula TaxID=40148 RepID=A0A0E0A777_9ORYZ
MPADELLHLRQGRLDQHLHLPRRHQLPRGLLPADEWRDGRRRRRCAWPRPPAAELPDLCIRGDGHGPPPAAVHGLKRSILAEVYAAAHAEPPPPELGQPASLACSAAHLPVRSREGERERGEGTGKKRGVRGQE